MECHRYVKKYDRNLTAKIQQQKTIRNFWWKVLVTFDCDKSAEPKFLLIVTVPFYFLLLKIDDWIGQQYSDILYIVIWMTIYKQINKQTLYASLDRHSTWNMRYSLKIEQMMNNILHNHLSMHLNFVHKFCRSVLFG